MTIEYVGAEIHGLSTDTKPEASDGKLFLETDTGTRFEFDDVELIWNEIPVTAKNITSTEQVNFADLTTMTGASFRTGSSGFIETGLLHILLPITQDTTPGGIFFQDNGTRAFIVGTNSATIYELDLGTAWQIDTAIDNGVNFVISEDTAPIGIFFKGDGTKMYVMGTTNKTVFEYDLSTPWSLASASFTGNSFLIPNSDEPNPLGVCLKSDGLHMFVTGTSGKIQDYTLSTAFDLSDTVTFFQSKDVSAQDTSPSGIFFRSDGTRMYFSGIQNDSVYEYNLTTAWDITTAVIFETVSISDIITTENQPHGLFIKPDASKLYVVGTDTATVYEFHLGLLIDGKIKADEGEFDIVKVDENIEFFDGSTQEQGSSPVPFVGALDTTILQSSQGLTETVVSGVYFKPDGLLFYTTDRDSDDLKEYSLDGGIPWDISGGITQSAVNVDILTDTTEDIFIRSDGLKIFTVSRGSGNANVNQYDLSTPFDISTMGTVTTTFLEVNSSIRALHFKPDGTRVYIGYFDDDTIDQYTLNIPWEIDSLDLGSKQTGTPTDASFVSMRFNQEGTILYSGTVDAFVRRYSVSSPWDITSTLTLLDEFNLDGDSAGGFYIKPNSDRMFTVNAGTGLVFAFDLGLKVSGKIPQINTEVIEFIDESTQVQGTTPEGFNWNVSTAINNGITISMSGAGTLGISFKYDGTVWFACDSTGVYQWETTQGWDIANATNTESFDPVLGSTEQGVFVRADGLKMYVMIQGGTITEYDLSTAWSLASTPTLVGTSPTLASIDNFLRDLSFSPDGKKLFFIGQQNGDAYQLNLSIPWDITTLDTSSVVTLQINDADIRGMYFKPDGTKVYTCGLDENVFQFDLTVAWDFSVSTLAETFDLTSSVTNAHAMAMRPDGSRMYILNSGPLFEFDLGIKTEGKLIVAEIEAIPIYPYRTDAGTGTIDYITTDTILGLSTTTGATVEIQSDVITKIGRVIIINDEGGNAGASPITISTEGSELIDDAATRQIAADHGVIRLYSDGSNLWSM